MNEENTLFPEQKIMELRPGAESFNRQFLRSKYSTATFGQMEQASALVRSFNAARRWLTIIEEVAVSKAEVAGLDTFMEQFGRKQDVHVQGMYRVAQGRVLEAELQETSTRLHEDDHERDIREKLEAKLAQVLADPDIVDLHDRYRAIRGVADLAGLPNPGLEKFFR